ncbi:MAG: trigger factor [Rhodospirillales bacterium]|nr:trigger factor [Rhodospirillales bacterium]
MQITETSADGLKREYKVVIAAADIAQKVDARLSELGRNVRLPGFRPGKVPMSMLKKRYGAHVMGEVLEQAVGDSSAQAMRERGLRPALQPRIEIVSFEEGADLEYKMNVELLPDITPTPLSEIELERLKPEIADSEVDRQLERIAENNRKTTPVDRPAESGDAVVIDFVGRIGGVEFPGGKGENHTLRLGSNQFIAGFEDQLVGAKAGEKRVVKVSFPKEYGNEELAGKEAEFEVEVKEVRAFEPGGVDEDLAQRIGFDSLDELKKTVREQLERDFAQLARQKLKRRVLDALAARHDFPVPTGMVDLEFETIWKQLEEERKRNPESASEDAGKSEDELKAEYRKIAERRVRLGLLLSEIGRQNNIQVTNEEVNRAIVQEARRFPGQERQVVEFYRKNPDALANLRAPIYEDKVIDFIVEMAKVTDKPVSPEELLKPEPDEEKAA